MLLSMMIKWLNLTYNFTNPFGSEALCVNWLCWCLWKKWLCWWLLLSDGGQSLIVYFFPQMVKHWVVVYSCWISICLLTLFSADVFSTYLLVFTFVWCSFVLFVPSWKCFEHVPTCGGLLKIYVCHLVTSLVSHLITS